MVFSSIIFTFIFLPVVLALYYIGRNDLYRNLLLLAASLVFYAYGEPRFVLVMLASILLNYLLALGVDRSTGHGRKTFLVLAVICNLGILYVFKYLGFTVEVYDLVTRRQVPVPDITLPIGISFFTFQALSYVIDVYRRDVPVQKNPLYLALYISFFPQLIAGPIVRYHTIAEEIEHHRTVTAEDFSYGCRRFMQGFAGKVLIANNLSLVAEQTFSVHDFGGEAHTILFYWIGAIAYSFQILFDFSGYSDMAIGLGRMFGFHFDENFREPYLATSVTDFWRRWHISLSRWFRDYVYIPLGGSRVPPKRHILNIFVVWLCTGIWHGANFTFLLWGMIYFVCLVVEKYLVHPERHSRGFRLLWRVVTLLVVNFEWVMFRADSVFQGVHYWLAMVGWNSHDPGWLAPENLRILRENGAYYLLAILAILLPAVLRRRGKTAGAPAVVEKAGDAGSLAGSRAGAVITAAAFLWAVSFLILGAHNPFIYFNF